MLGERTGNMGNMNRRMSAVTLSIEGTGIDRLEDG